MKLEYFGSVNEHGQLHIRNRKMFDEELKQFAGKEVEIVVVKKKRTRSIQINRYYWGVVIALVRDAFIDLGHEVESQEVHEYLKGRFNFKELVNEETGEVVLDENGLPIHIPLSTANISNTDFMVYMERIKKFSSETLSIYIPEPGEQLTLT